ncbi:histidinol dehydrogenase [Marinithermus hydrothermalis]|uniref:Histidinol dehydrogenase n=1 Tax=Marinithermus hydrothermalis (strain DSM 14884 / JCM 11576 / T1) TaxID=869210 RepID=F2NLC4_MARHT|nr:Histidinol dehydrogenase [Marinithermus hydrothermalis DSM 14884]
MRVYRAEEVRDRFRSRRLAFTVSERLKEGIARHFGEALSPEEAVRRILAEVAREGDTALDRWSERLDGHPVEEVPKRAWREAYDDLPAALRHALDAMRERVQAFYAREPQGGFVHADADGVLMQLVRPLERVGVYVPGGSAPLVSTVVMTVVPARVAGVEEVILATPPKPHPAILAAAWVVGADRLFAMGGAQAIGALAYGTARVPRVDKIVGPGNLFVTLAKKEVFGTVGIDGLAGPTETLIVADSSADPKVLAADLLAQAEHDSLAEPWLVSPDAALLERVKAELKAQLADLPRAGIAREALAQGGMVWVRDLEEAVELANLYAPEHLCLSVADPAALLGKVRNAGGVFLGEHSGEALGDYVAGPSHVMPTAGTARFQGGLSVRDFLKVIPVVGLTRDAAARLAEPGAEVARAEALEAHARALLRRKTD